MNRSTALTLFAMTVVAASLLPGAGYSQQRSLKDQLVGVWTLVSADTTPASGTKRQDFGPNPKGILIIDASGKYAVVQGSPDRPKFKDTSNLRGGATAEELAAAARPFAANFGTWSVDEGNKTLTRNYEIALIPNNDGLVSKVSVNIAGDELKLSGTAANGTRLDAVYKRAK